VEQFQQDTIEQKDAWISFLYKTKGCIEMQGNQKFKNSWEGERGRSDMK